MTDDFFMNLAIQQAKKAEKFGDVPVGAVIVKDGKVISKAYNKKELKQNAIYHAEILAITKASKKLKNFRLSGCTIYVTKEPCLMCIGAILSARIEKLVFGSYDKRFSHLELLTNNNFNHKCNYTGGVLQEQTNKMLTNFFKNIRKED